MYHVMHPFPIIPYADLRAYIIGFVPMLILLCIQQYD
jgi:hypothetical protein